MSALTPRPGIMKISPYVPGKDSVDGKEPIAKLSSNEGALGPSPRAMAAYAAATRVRIFMAHLLSPRGVNVSLLGPRKAPRMHKNRVLRGP